MNEKLKLLIDSLNESEQSAIFAIIQSLEASKKKHPNFAGKSLTYCASIVAEEAGEFCRAINQQVYEDGNSIDSGIEATHVGAVAIRALCILSKTKDTIVSRIEDLTQQLKNITEEEPAGVKLLRLLNKRVAEIKKETGIDEIAIITITPTDLSFSDGNNDSMMGTVKWIAYLKESIKLMESYIAKLTIKQTSI